MPLYLNVLSLFMLWFLQVFIINILLYLAYQTKCLTDMLNNNINAFKTYMELMKVGEVYYGKPSIEAKAISKTHSGFCSP